MSKFPLIEELGLDVELVCGNGDSRYYGEVFSAVSAESLERLLSQAPVIQGGYPDGENFEQMTEDALYTARLIGVKEIKKDSAEDLLRDLLEKFESGQGFDMSPYMNRAKKLLEGKE